MVCANDSCLEASLIPQDLLWDTREWIQIKEIFKADTTGGSAGVGQSILRGRVKSVPEPSGVILVSVAWSN